MFKKKLELKVKAVMMNKNILIKVTKLSKEEKLRMNKMC